MAESLRTVEGVIFDLDQTAIHDGPGVRMNVYLKGCPLRCLWCHSPESQSFRPEVVWYETRCVRCGRCVEVCPEGIRSLDLIDEAERARCRLCGRCVEVCQSRALEVKGRTVRAGEIADEAVRLMPFFRRTGGGVTLTGGEPLAQAAFSRAVATLCKRAGVHVAMETCGYAEWRVLARFVGVVDLFLYDVKHVVERLHRQHTGVSNRRIMANLRRLAEAGAEVVVRVPLIPGVNDDAETVRTIGRRIADIGVRRATLLPFNPATPGKYSWLGRQSPFDGAATQTSGHLDELRRVLETDRLQVVPA